MASVHCWLGFASSGIPDGMAIRSGDMTLPGGDRRPIADAGHGEKIPRPPAIRFDFAP
jgi:hypothetical protein